MNLGIKNGRTLEDRIEQKRKKRKKKVAFNYLLSSVIYVS